MAGPPPTGTGSLRRAVRRRQNERRDAQELTDVIGRANRLEVACLGVRRVGELPVQMISQRKKGCGPKLT